MFTQSEDLIDLYRRYYSVEVSASWQEQKPQTQYTRRHVPVRLERTNAATVRLTSKE